MRDVFIVGGTHGNEWTGITIVENLKHQIQNPSKLDLHYLLANPEAFKINRRYKDEDLNRVFAKLDSNPKSQTYEFQRAQEIRTQLLTKPDAAIIDLHTTTGNMGRTLIIPSLSQWHKCLALHVSQKLPDTKIIVTLNHSKKYLATQLDHGAIIEVGPCSQGVNNPLVIEQTIELTNCILEFIDKNDLSQTGHFDYYVETEEVHYPQKNGMLSGMVHASLQNREFYPLKKGDALFYHFDGTTQNYEGDKTFYPIFINEAAYYPYNIAMVLCEKLKMDLNP
jgi:succinylglutamate desuccinylase